MATGTQKSILSRYFTPEQQKQLIDEDRVAFQCVFGILFSVITAGLIAGVITVLAIVF